MGAFFGVPRLTVSALLNLPRGAFSGLGCDPFFARDQRQSVRFGLTFCLGLTESGEFRGLGFALLCRREQSLRPRDLGAYGILDPRDRQPDCDLFGGSDYRNPTSYAVRLLCR